MVDDRKEDDQQQYEDKEDPTKEDDDDDEQEQAATSKRKRKRKRKKKGQSENDKDDNDKQAEPEQPPLQNNSSTPFLTAADESKAQQVDRTVFVEGIPFTCTVDAVRNFFVQKLQDSNSTTDDKQEEGVIVEDIRLPVWHDSGRLRGYGHVVLRKSALYQQALALSGQYLQNRYLSIRPAQAPKSGATTTGASSSAIDHSHPSVTVALHNLSYQATEQDIEDVMKKYGDIAEGGVRIVRHSDTGRSKGFGYVQYTNTASATKACRAASSIVIAGRPCRLDYDHGRVRGSFRTVDRKLWHKEYKQSNPGSNLSSGNARHKRARQDDA